MTEPKTSFAAVLRRIDGAGLWAALTGVTPEDALAVANADAALAVIDGILAALRAESEFLDSSLLALPFPFDAPPLAETEGVLRGVLEAALRQAALRLEAADGDRTFDLALVSARGTAAALVAGDGAFCREVVARLGYPAALAAAAGTCAVEIMPRPVGEAAGARAVLHPEVWFEEAVSDLIDAAVYDASTGAVDAVDVLVRAGGIDLSGLLGFADTDERRRLNALYALASRIVGSRAPEAVVAAARGCVFRRSLAQGLLTRIADRALDIGVGVLEPGSALLPAAWRYASSSDTAAVAAVSLAFGEGAPGTGLFAFLSVVLRPPEDAPLPRIVCVPTGCPDADRALRRAVPTALVVTPRDGPDAAAEVISRFNTGQGSATP